MLRLARVGIALIGTAAITVPLAGVSESSPGSVSDPVLIDFESGALHEANGQPIDVTWTSTDPAETAGYAFLSTGEQLDVFRQSALPVDPEIFEEPVEHASTDVLEEAIEYPDVLPRDMVSTNYTQGTGASLDSGSIASAPASPDAFELSAISAVTETAISYAWADDAHKFEVVRDGELVATVFEPSFTESGFAPGESVDYEITSIGADGSILATRYVPLTTTGGVVEPELHTWQEYNSQALYRTFISDSRVSLGFWETLGCGQAFKENRTFGGDGRTYHLPTRSAPYDGVSSRTSVALNVNWGNPAPYDIMWVTEVGTTHLYEGSALIEARTASSDGIEILDASSTTSYAQARVAHEVGNPFCAAGAIKYNVVFRLYRSGTFEVVGWRQPVPHHEVYGGWDNGNGLINWHTFGRYPNDGFGCLVGACGNETINVARTY